MSPLLERARAALAPSYRIEASLGVGGMGEVFCAMDLALQRPVAVKVLRPEVATAVAVERFLREARILARLSHPHIVPVHHAGEAEGLYYFVMELQAGETLAARLERGPLPVAEALRVAREVLAALGAAHDAGVIHRDVKPSNIFLDRAGARLGDFGIAHDESDPGPTRSGDLIGTVAYMAPEQRAGLPATARSDQYSTAAVIYECLTGRRWAEREGDWSDVPPRLVAPLRRALERAAEARWPHARAFAAALEGGGALRRRAGRTVVAVLSVSLLAIGLHWLLERGNGDGAAAGGDGTGARAAAPGALLVGLAPFTPDPADPASAVEQAFRRRLEEAHVPLAGTGEAELLLVPSVERAGPELVVRLGARGARGDLRDLHVERRGAADRPAALGDSLAAATLPELWRFENSDSLPARALPRRLGAIVAWAAGERHFARAEWNDARQAYSRAMREDPGCLVCEWRRLLIARWYQEDLGPEPIRRLALRADSFPDPFSSLIRASAQPFPARLDSLAAVRDRFPHDHLAHFLLGDEVLHRGALDGVPRRTAGESFAAAGRLRPGFLPAWEHAAWLGIAEGRPGEAMAALGRHGEGLNGDPHAASIAALLRIAAAWRFAGPVAGGALLDTLLAIPGLARSPMAGTAPRWLVWFGVPDGALELARRFLAGPDSAAHHSAATYAQAFASAVLGQPDSAVAALGRLANPTDAARWRAILSTALAAADPADPDAARLAAEHRAALTALAGDRRAPALAAEAALLLALQGGDPRAAPAGPARLLAEADALARGGSPAGALALSDLLHDRETTAGPLWRALLHLRRGEWRLALGDAEGARREWVWHENQDVEGTLLEGPVAAELDWALGTLARWKRARAGRGPEACADYAEVARLWSDGNATARARADSARAARRALGCEGA